MLTVDIAPGAGSAMSWTAIQLYNGRDQQAVIIDKKDPDSGFRAGEASALLTPGYVGRPKHWTSPVSFVSDL